MKAVQVKAPGMWTMAQSDICSVGSDVICCNRSRRDRLVYRRLPQAHSSRYSNFSQGKERTWSAHMKNTLDLRICWQDSIMQYTDGALFVGEGIRTQPNGYQSASRTLPSPSWGQRDLGCWSLWHSRRGWQRWYVSIQQSPIERR